MSQDTEEDLEQMLSQAASLGYEAAENGLDLEDVQKEIVGGSA